MNPILLMVAITSVGLLIATVWAVLARPRESPVQTRLQEWSNWEKHQDAGPLPPRREPKRNALLDLDTNTTFLADLSRTLKQVKSPYNLGTFLLLTLVALMGSGALVSILTTDLLRIVISALAGGFAPYAVLMYKKLRYLRQIESQLPQTLDMLAQSLRAGLTIQTGIRIIGDDFEEPMRSEFRRTSEAIEFGVPLTTALEALALRLDISDLRFFVTSVLVQRETGGNLAEIIANTANLVRERLEFNDRIKALSAEGKASAYILSIIPVALSLYFYVTAPRHFETILNWEWGATALIATAGWMLIGMMIIQRMVKIDV